MEKLQKVIRGWRGLSEVTGLSRTKLQSLVGRGVLPKSLKLSERRVGWLENDLAEWQSKLAATRGEPCAMPIQFPRRKPKVGGSIPRRRLRARLRQWQDHE
jgi:predicted DNA-binding transcriptional regulator AlpA